MIKIPPQVNKAIELLQEAGFEAYIVGGFMRDSLMGQAPSDYDIATSARPEEMRRVFCGFNLIETGLRHGTVTVIIQGFPIEITTYRVDGKYLDSRHPDKVTFVTSLREDMARRDFTINALAYNPSQGLVDYFGGKQDIEAGVIKCVGEPALRFGEDALRIMRCLRFASVLGFEIEQKTLEGAIEARALLDAISPERIREELVKLLCGKSAGKVLRIGTAIFQQVMPEITPMIGFDQYNKHHIFDVWEHTIETVSAIRPEPDLRLTALMHDMGKPQCYFIDEEGQGHAYGHAKVSANMATDIMNRLRFDNETKANVKTLIYYHDAPIAQTSRAIKRALNKLTPELFFKMIALMRADNLAQSPEYRYRQNELDQLEAMAREIMDKEECFSLKNLALDGKDLIEAGFAPGRELGEVLNRLLEAVIEEEVPNQKEILLKRAKSFMEKSKKC